MASYIKLPKGTKPPKKPAGVKSVPRSLGSSGLTGLAKLGYSPKGTKPKTTVIDPKGVTDPTRTPRTAPKPEVNPGTAPKRPVGRKPKAPTQIPRGGIPVRPTRPTTARPTKPSRRGGMAGMRRRLRGMRGQR